MLHQPYGFHQYPFKPEPMQHATPKGMPVPTTPMKPSQGTASQPIVISNDSMEDQTKNQPQAPAETQTPHFSLGRGIDHVLSMTGAEGFGAISTLEKNVFDWHIANLEYGCATDLSRVSLEEWDQVPR